MSPSLSASVKHSAAAVAVIAGDDHGTIPPGVLRNSLSVADDVSATMSSRPSPSRSTHRGFVRLSDACPTTVTGHGSAIRRTDPATDPPSVSPINR